MIECVLCHPQLTCTIPWKGVGYRIQRTVTHDKDILTIKDEHCQKLEVKPESELSNLPVLRRPDVLSKT